MANKRYITEREFDWFCELNHLLPTLPKKQQAQIMEHLDYLKNNGDGNLQDKDFKAIPDMFYDAINNILSIIISKNLITQFNEERELTQQEKAYIKEFISNLSQFPEDIKISTENNLNKLFGQNFQDLENLDILKAPNLEIRALLGKLHNFEKYKKPTLSSSPDELIALSQKTLEGWCSEQKCKLIFDIIKKEKPKLGVEIGIFGGRSLIPAAVAMKDNGFGVMYGIEAWSGKIATENFTSSQNDIWWNEIDLLQVKNNFLYFIINNNLTDIIKILEISAASVFQAFDTIDYLHIDGSHSIWNSTEDVILYAKKVKSGGIIIFDDVELETTKNAVQILDTIAERTESLYDEDNNVICLFYRKK